MLLNGINHVAVLTADTDRFVDFYATVFGATVDGGMDMDEQGTGKLTIVRIGPHTELNVFEVRGVSDHVEHTPMFGRGPLDHMGLEAADLDAFETARQRLIERGCTDGFVTDFGPVLSLFFVDPDGLEGEVCVQNPDAQPGVLNPPGTPSRRYHG